METGTCERELCLAIYIFGGKSDKAAHRKNSSDGVETLDIDKAVEFWDSSRNTSRHVSVFQLLSQLAHGTSAANEVTKKYTVYAKITS